MIVGVTHDIYPQGYGFKHLQDGGFGHLNTNDSASHTVQYALTLLKGGVGVFRIVVCSLERKACGPAPAVGECLTCSQVLHIG